MYITIDIGGTHVRVSSFSDLDPKTFQNKTVLASKDLQKYQTGLEQIQQTINALTNGQSPKGIGISMAGSMDPVTGTVISSDSFSDWAGGGLTNDLSKKLDCPVKLENDAVVAGLAEKVFGPGKSSNKMGFIIIGTGVGAVRIQNFSGKTLVYPTEFGHIPVEFNGHSCICGQKGCLECYTSGKGFRSLYGKAPEEINDPRVWDKTTDYLTQGLMTFLIFHPAEIVVFGGGVASNKPEIIGQIETKLKKHFDFDIPKLSLSKFSGNAGSVGGLALLNKDANIVNMKFAD